MRVLCSPRRREAWAVLRQQGTSQHTVSVELVNMYVCNRLVEHHPYRPSNVVGCSCYCISTPTAGCSAGCCTHTGTRTSSPCGRTPPAHIYAENIAAFQQQQLPTSSDRCRHNLHTVPTHLAAAPTQGPGSAPGPFACTQPVDTSHPAAIADAERRTSPAHCRMQRSTAQQRA
jgi:hypothetical protein